MKLLSALVLALILVSSSLVTLGLIYTALKEAAASHGSWAGFEGRLRHYSDRLDLDGRELRIVRAAHPVGALLGALAVSSAAAAGSGMLLRRVGGRERSAPD